MNNLQFYNPPRTAAANPAASRLWQTASSARGISGSEIQFATMDDCLASADHAARLTPCVKNKLEASGHMLG